MPIQAEGPGPDPPPATAALHALFARISRNVEQVICPINECALDAADRSPAFYCVHSLSGAGGTDFGNLARLMPTVRFYGIQAPPKKMRDARFGGSVEALAEYYADALVSFQPDGPFLLGGWSAGATIGLQIAQNLLARGRDVSLLAAIDAAPENAAAGHAPWHPLYLLALARNVPRWIVHEDLLTKSFLQSLLRRASTKAIALGKSKTASKDMVDGHPVAAFMDLSYYPPEQKSFMKRLYDALFEYIPREYPGDVVVYEAEVKPLLHSPQVGEVWRKLAARSVIVRVEGTHLSLLREPYVSALAADLQRRISHSTSRNYPTRAVSSAWSQSNRPASHTGQMQPI